MICIFLILKKFFFYNLHYSLFLLEVNINDGTHNCKINIPKLNKIYDNKLTCKSKKDAKNEISEIVFKILTNQKYIYVSILFLITNFVIIILINNYILY